MHLSHIQTPYSLLCFVRREDSKFFGQEKVFGPLVRDLRDLEEAGVELDSGQIILVLFIIIIIIIIIIIKGSACNSWR